MTDRTQEILTEFEGIAQSRIPSGKHLSEISLDWLPVDGGVVVICHFDGSLGPVPQNPGVHFQVTLRYDGRSPSGKFIAFDSTKGDQIHGWMRRDQIVVDEILKVKTAPTGP